MAAVGNTNNTNNASIVNSDGNINNNNVNNNNVGVSPASSKHPIMSLRRAVQRSKYNDLCLFCIVSYNGHLSHGHTYKLKKKVMSKFVLTKSPENGGIVL